MTVKVLSVLFVLSVACIFGLMSAIVAVSHGARRWDGIRAGSTAFISIAGLGMILVNYLMPTTSS
ncbi:hypothetical protein J2Z21_009767 [Streptomyces griseochromogenes]|uniref:Uncharacterized protein n=1 Tax=Streptomyces griseochromogenes TaxID=68214 RepID=A0A1B1AZU1_9ACTN|nr:hypothetical protein [Streptomyces griseochromogenes]ANP52079.1 hypothetical protein AVL59_23155 [Streptomyces griseochromogenes]MBP2056748.1 hypothetical protein [Streptomyces griseochromogenes]